MLRKCNEVNFVLKINYTITVLYSALPLGERIENKKKYTNMLFVKQYQSHMKIGQESSVTL